MICAREISQYDFLMLKQKGEYFMSFFVGIACKCDELLVFCLWENFIIFFFSFSVLFPLFVYFIFFLRVDDSLWVWSVWKYLKTNKLWVVCKNKYFLSLSEYFRLKHLKERRENLLFFFFYLCITYTVFIVL